MSDEPLSRRQFFNYSWRLAGAFVVGQGIYVGFRFLESRKGDGIFGEEIIAGMVDEFPPGTVTPFEAARFYLVRFEDGGFLAVYRKCTHLACMVSWDEAHNRFACPCHGSKFERDGDVINPPAPRPLDRFPITIAASGRIRVDTGKPIERDEASPDDLVYYAPPE